MYRDDIGFSFFIPTNIMFGNGMVENLPELDAVRGKRCMLLRFPYLKRVELIDRLRSNADELVVAEEFEENPGYNLVKTIGERVARNKIDTLIAIGGGSTIDTAKAAAWFAAGEGPPATGIVAVPTTAGTGSEVTPYAILTHEKTKRKQILNHQSLFPCVALCDPELTCTVPAHVTANTGIDALSHAIEAYLCVKCQGFMEEIALSSCKLVKDNLLKAIEDPYCLMARKGMMLASLQAGMVLAMCGTVLVHALGYELTRKYGYAHGYSNGILLGNFVKHLYDRGSRRAAKIMDIFNGDLNGFVKNTGIPVVLPHGSVNGEAVSGWVDSAYNSYGRPNCVVPIGKDDIRIILERAIK